jgi:hypothetical protein
MHECSALEGVREAVLPRAQKCLVHFLVRAVGHVENRV